MNMVRECWLGWRMGSKSKNSIIPRDRIALVRDDCALFSSCSPNTEFAHQDVKCRWLGVCVGKLPEWKIPPKEKRTKKLCVRLTGEREGETERCPYNWTLKGVKKLVFLGSSRDGSLTTKERTFGAMLSIRNAWATQHTRESSNIHHKYDPLQQLFSWTGLLM